MAEWIAHTARSPARTRSRITRCCSALHGVSPIVKSAERAGTADLVDRDIPHVVDAAGPQPVHLRDLGNADRGLVEYAVNTGGTVVIGRHLRGEQQRTSHDAAR